MRKPGTVNEVRPGVWRIRVSVGQRPDGRRHALTKQIHGSQRDANRVLAELLLEAQRLRDRPGQSDTDTVAGWLTEWMTSRRAVVREHTTLTYERNCRLHLLPHIGHLRLRQLTGLKLTKLYADLVAGGLSPRTVCAIHAMLRASLRQAEAQGLIADAPTKFAELPRWQKPKIEVPSHEDIRTVLKATKGTWVRTAVMLVWATGTRRGELTGLEWTDLDLDKQRLRVCRNIAAINGNIVVGPPKSQEGNREISLPDTLVAELRTHRPFSARSKCAGVFARRCHWCSRPGTAAFSDHQRWGTTSLT